MSNIKMSDVLNPNDVIIPWDEEIDKELRKQLKSHDTMVKRIDELESALIGMVNTIDMIWVSDDKPIPPEKCLSFYKSAKELLGESK